MGKFSGSKKPGSVDAQGDICPHYVWLDSVHLSGLPLLWIATVTLEDVSDACNCLHEVSAVHGQESVHALLNSSCPLWSLHSTFFSH